MTEYLILVDPNDIEKGKMEKLLVHQLGLLHRAFSVFIFNTKGELILQQRADEKYHSAGLWTNTCCSHPQYGEDVAVAIKRRLHEEMGLACETHFAFKFIYKAQFQNGLMEYECDHVYFGITNDHPILKPEEAKDWRYISLSAIEAELTKHSENYTEWLKICFVELKEHYNKINF